MYFRGFAGWHHLRGYIYVFFLREAPHRVHCFKGKCWPADLFFLQFQYSFLLPYLAGKRVADVSVERRVLEPKCGVGTTDSEAKLEQLGQERRFNLYACDVWENKVPLFLTTNSSIQNTYWEWRGRTHNFLNKSRHESWLLEFINKQQTAMYIKHCFVRSPYKYYRWISYLRLWLQRKQHSSFFYMLIWAQNWMYCIILLGYFQYEEKEMHGNVDSARINYAA